MPKEVLNYAEKIYNDLNVPNLSLDIAFDGNECYLFEFQANSLSRKLIFIV